MTTQRQRRAARMICLLLAAVLLSVTPSISQAQSAGSCGASGGGSGAIVLDGQFSDWAGQSCIPDPVADCSNGRADLVSFFFTTPPNDPSAYFMVETATGANQPLGLRLRIDTNNDGVYTSAIDRIIEIRYQPGQNDSDVEIDLLDGEREKVAEIARDEDWGESRAEGSNRVEWGVTLAQLGVPVGQPIRMMLQSRGGSPSGGSWCDSTQEVQWSPADALGPVLLAAVLVGGAVLAARRRRGRV
jgi:hypothetical protein